MPRFGLGFRLSAFGFRLSLALLAGCSFAPEYKRPATEVPSAYKEISGEQPAQAGWKTAEPNDGALRGDWWQIFHDAELNALELDLNASNQTVAAAAARFLAARAVVKQSQSEFFPLVSASPGVTRSRQPAVRTSGGRTTNPRTTTEYSLPLDATWELDFWGRIRNSVAANAAEAQATMADLENIRLSAQAELAADYFEIRSLDAQKQLLDAAVIAYVESLKLTQARHSTGIASEQDVAQAETLLHITEAQVTDLAIQRARLEHAIALLIGKPASLFSLPVGVEVTKPTNSPVEVEVTRLTGLPSELLERRPDVASSERRVAAANAEIGVARAAYFPTVTLGGSVGYRSTSLSDLISGPTFAWSIGATLAQTIFDAGRRRAVTEQARANYEGTVADYRQTVLTAFQEVEDSLSSLRLLTQEIAQQDAAINASQRYLTLASDRYKLGIDSYLNVITAQTTLLNNQRTSVTLRAQQATASVQLIKALGGGWNDSDLMASK